MATLNFTDDELGCKCGCATLNTHPKFIKLMANVQTLRSQYGKPLRITSAYRCPKHPIEAAKAKAGQHSIAAIDLGVSRTDAHEVIRLAMLLGFTGLGVNQKGGQRFIHLDNRDVPTVWSY